MGGGTDYSSGIVIDNQDNVYVSGLFEECYNPINDPYYGIPKIGDNNSIDFTSTSSSSSSCQREFIAKFNNDGIFQWIHYPYSPLSDPVYAPNTMRISRNFYIINNVIHWIVYLFPGTYENGAVVNTNTSLPFLTYIFKYDVNGSFLEATLFDLQMSGFTSAELRWYRNPYNGNYYAVTRHNTNNTTIIAGGNTLSANPSKIICFNAQGQYLWHRETTGIFAEILTIGFDNSNNTYVVGVTHSFGTDTFLGFNISGTNTGTTAFIMKCNSDVTAYSWVNYYTTNSLAGYAQLSDVTLYYNSYADEILFGGGIGTEYFNWGGQTEIGPGMNNARDPLLARFNPHTGACIDMHRLVGGNGYEDGFTKIIQDNNGDLILGGFMGYQLTDSNGTNYYSYGGNSDFMVTKFATEPCPSLANEDFEESNLYLYPNPTTDILHINLTENAAYILYDILGKELQRGNLSPNENTINLSGFEKGIYLLSINNQQFKVLRD